MYMSQINTKHRYNLLKQSIKQMQQTIATVNINMGYGQNNPVLLITPSTNVNELVTKFIQSYQLPYSAFQVIMDTIITSLQQENIDIHMLGKSRTSFKPVNCQDRKQKKQGRTLRVESENHYVRQSCQDEFNQEEPHQQQFYHRNQELKNKMRLQHGCQKQNANESRNKKQPISWDRIKQKKQLPITRIQNPKKCTSPMLKGRVIEQKPTKITLLRTKSPVDHKNPKTSPNPHRSPTPKRTPLRERQLTSQTRTHLKQFTSDSESIDLNKISNLFDWLTRNQPKTMKILNPEYASFNGIKHEALIVLQDFFEALDQSEFKNMDKHYFINRLKQFGLHIKLSKYLD